jgi:hypothetical protein
MVVEEVSVLDQVVDDAARKVLEKSTTENQDNVTQKEAESLKGTNKVSVTAPTQKVTNYLRSVHLYLPVGLQFQDGVQYENMDLGNIGAGVEAGVGAVDAFLGAGKNAITSLVDQFSGSTASASGKLATLNLAKNLAPDEVFGGLKSKLGVSINPNSRMLFKQPNIRQFSYTFKLIAKSRDEAEEIKKIVKLFREELYPEKIGGSLGGVEFGFGYKFPNKFKIDFLYDNKLMDGKEGRPYAPKIKNCYLTAVNTVFNQTNMAMHDDGNFTEVDITLAFTEERALTKEDILRGY